MSIEVHKILEYSDLFTDKEKFDIRGILCKYKRCDIVRIINCLGINFGNAFIPDKNTFFSYESKCYVDLLNPKIDAYLTKNHLKKVCICTLRSILELTRYMFSIPVAEYQNNGKCEDIEYDLFRVILYINEDLMAFKMNEDEMNKANMIFVLSYIYNDVTNADESKTFISQYLYFDLLNRFLEENPKGKELKNAFLSKLGIKNMNEYAQTIIALIVLYINERKEDKNGCPFLNLNVLNDEIGFIHKQICDYLSLNLNSVIPYNAEDNKNRENNEDYRTLRAHPLIKMPDDRYLIYSLPIMCERIYNSLFFDLKECWEGETGSYFNFYDKEVVEHYMFQREMLNCIGNKTTVYAPSSKDIMQSESEIEDKFQPDFYIREKDKLFLFECKAIKINGALKEKTDVTEFLRVLKNKLYLSTENLDISRRKKKNDELVGVTQLVKQIELIEDDNFIWDKKIPDDVSYYPVIVLEDPKLTQTGIMGMVNDWLMPLKNEKLPEANVNPIIVVSISTLFCYSEIFQEFGFGPIFDRFYKTSVCYGCDYLDWTLSPYADFVGFMEKNYKIGPKKKNYFLQIMKRLQG